jgi:D-alanyl-D-alanine carboxypeptidase
MVTKVIFKEACFDKLSYAGKDFFDRELLLEKQTLKSVNKMIYDSLKDGIRLYIVSGFRSYEYQQGIIDRKLANGQLIEDIQKVNAVPGQSEHHTGRAIDFTTSDESEVLTECFEKTEAFKWLTKNAHKYNFFMSFPRNNKYGFIYEPWHWCYNNENN